MMIRRALPFLAALLVSGPVMAGSVSQSVTATVRAKPLMFTLTQITADCAWAPGQLVATLSASGGDGNPVTLSLTQPASDFTINASTGAISVGPNGIAAANCGTTENVTVTATQP